MMFVIKFARFTASKQQNLKLNQEVYPKAPALGLDVTALQHTLCVRKQDVIKSTTPGY